MAYSEELAECVRAHLAGTGFPQKKRFGGIRILFKGNMVCGITDDTLMVRTGPDGYEDALAQDHASEMDFTGRPLRGFVFVALEGLANGESLGAWIERGRAFARSLPAK